MGQRYFHNEETTVRSEDIDAADRILQDSPPGWGVEVNADEPGVVTVIPPEKPSNPFEDGTIQF